MARPSFKSSLRALSLFIVILLTPSCLDLSVAVEFRNSTAGQIRVDALSRRMAQGLQILDPNDLVIFPVTRAQWQTLVDLVPGATLVSWTGADEDLGFRSTAVLGFSNARSLEGLFVVFKQKLTLLQDAQGKWTVTLVPQIPRLTGGNAESRRLWSALWGEVTWSFAFTPPSQPRAEYTVSMADLAGAKAPPDWTLSWSP